MNSEDLGGTLCRHAGCSAGMSEMPAGNGWCGGVRRCGAAYLTGDEVLEVEQVAVAAVGDGLEGAHDRGLVDLLFEEPLHELLTQEVSLVARGLRQVDDLIGDGLLLRERVLDRCPVVGERVLGLFDAGELHGDVAVEEVLHDHHGVVEHFYGLIVEVLGQLREVFVVVDRATAMYCCEEVNSWRI